MWRNIGFLEIIYHAMRSISDTSLFESMINTAVVSGLSALIATSLALWLAVFSGKKDGWVLGKTAETIRNIVIIVAIIPSPLYVIFFSDLIIDYPRIMVTILLTIVGLSLGLFCLQESLFDRVIRYERYRKSLGLTRFRYWLQTYTVIIKITILFLFWVGLLGWNDVVIQLFAQAQFDGLPSAFLPLARDGLSDNIAAALALLQIGIIFLTLPVTYFAYKQIRRMPWPI